LRAKFDDFDVGSIFCKLTYPIGHRLFAKNSNRTLKEQIWPSKRVLQEPPQRRVVKYESIVDSNLKNNGELMSFISFFNDLNSRFNPFVDNAKVEKEEIQKKTETTLFSDVVLKNQENITQKNSGLENKIVEPVLSTEKINSFSAMIVGLVSKVLIERTFFQREGISKETLLYVVNDLIFNLNPPKNEKMSVSKECGILYKQQQFPLDDFANQCV
jgi:hypothetical protein